MNKAENGMGILHGQCIVIANFLVIYLFRRRIIIAQACSIGVQSGTEHKHSFADTELHYTLIERRACKQLAQIHVMIKKCP